MLLKPGKFQNALFSIFSHSNFNFKGILELTRRGGLYLQRVLFLAMI